MGEAEADICGRYGVASIGTLDPAAFEPAAGGVFLVAWAGDQAVGCAGVRRLEPAIAELKRLYVVPTSRRSGVARRLLAETEDAARRLGYQELWLETGTEQPEALALYRSAGYEPIAPFRPVGAPGRDDRSRFFGRRLDDPAAASRRGLAS